MANYAPLNQSLPQVPFLPEEDFDEFLSLLGVPSDQQAAEILSRATQANSRMQALDLQAGVQVVKSAAQASEVVEVGSLTSRAASLSDERSKLVSTLHLMNQHSYWQVSDPLQYVRKGVTSRAASMARVADDFGEEEARKYAELLPPFVSSVLDSPDLEYALRGGVDWHSKLAEEISSAADGFAGLSSTLDEVELVLTKIETIEGYSDDPVVSLEELNIVTEAASLGRYPGEADNSYYASVEAFENEMNPEAFKQFGGSDEQDKFTSVLAELGSDSETRNQLRSLAEQLDVDDIRARLATQARDQAEEEFSSGSADPEVTLGELSQIKLDQMLSDSLAGCLAPLQEMQELQQRLEDSQVFYEEMCSRYLNTE